MLQSRSTSHSNSFTFVRLALALAVVFGHTFAIGGFGADPFYWWSGRRLAIHELALQGFFILSGYLLTQSLTLQPSLGRFAVRRCFRILPAYWVALLITALGVAPALFAAFYPGRLSYGESLNLPEYSALGYIAHNAFLWSGQNCILPLFLGNPIRGVINGSLWSIFYEAICYVALGLAAGMGLLKRRNVVLVVFVVLYVPTVIQAVFPLPSLPAAQAWGRILNVMFHPAGPNTALPFAAGVATHFLVNGRSVWSARWFCIALAAFAVSLPLGAVRVFCPLVVPYLLLCLGEKLPLQKFERIGDFSYGTYIYAYLIQQCLAQFGVHRLGFGAYLALCVALSVAAGAVSWILIERPAIHLGQRLLLRRPWPASTQDAESQTVCVGLDKHPVTAAPR